MTRECSSWHHPSLLRVCDKVLQSEHIKEARYISRGFRKLQRLEENQSIARTYRLRANKQVYSTSLCLAHDPVLNMWTLLLVVIATGSPALLQAAPVQGE